jgi:hypothetical protein
MKRLLMLVCLSLCGCAGNFELLNNHNLLYKTPDGQLSIYKDRACYPWRNHFYLCVESAGINGVIITANYRPEDHQ